MIDIKKNMENKIKNKMLYNNRNHNNNNHKKNKQRINSDYNVFYVTRTWQRMIYTQYKNIMHIVKNVLKSFISSSHSFYIIDSRTYI
jgi:hypothetical protein